MIVITNQDVFNANDEIITIMFNNLDIDNIKSLTYEQNCLTFYPNKISHEDIEKWDSEINKRIAIGVNQWLKKK